MAGPLALTQECCKTPCTEPESIQVPGPAGVAGADGVDGEDGLSPVTTVSAQFLMPAEGANVTVAVGNSEGLVAGQPVFVQTAGTMQVISKPNNISVILQNLENTAVALYPNNAAPTTAIPSGSLISPAGFQGNAGVLSGAAGGHLKGTYPNPTIALNNTKGALIVGDGTNSDDLSPGTDDQVLHAASGQPLGLQYRGIDLSGASTDITGAVPIANGGHGQITANLGFNALSPVTTRGDLIYRNATVNARLAIATSGRVLGSNGTDPGWTQITTSHIDPAFKLLQRQGLIATGTINLNAAAGTDVALTSLSTRYIIRQVIISDASTTLAVSAARIGLYTAAATAGTAIVTNPNSELTNLTGVDIWDDLTLAAAAGFTVFTSLFLFAYLGVAHGSAATIKIYVFGQDLSA